MGKRRIRREPEPGEFRDPLSNYDPKVYADELERSLCEDPLTVIECVPVCRVKADVPIREALATMAGENVACLIVVDDDDRPIGMFTERDVMTRVAGRYPGNADRPVESVMTNDPNVIYESESPAHALNIMGSGMFRHLPVVDVDGKLIGVIGARRMTAYLQQHVNM